MFTVAISTVDGKEMIKEFTSIKKANKFAVYHVGENPEIGRNYATSYDGICVARVRGCTLEDLFAGEIKPVCPFQLFVFSVNEDAGTTSRFVIESFATLAEAEAVFQSDRYEIYDGAELAATTEEAKAELEALRKLKIADFYVREEDEFGIPF